MIVKLGGIIIATRQLKERTVFEALESAGQPAHHEAPDEVVIVTAAPALRETPYHSFVQRSR